MRIADMTPREQLNFALCGDPNDDDTYIIDEDECRETDACCCSACMSPSN